MWPRKTANRASRSGFTQTTLRASANRSRLAHRQTGAHSSPVELRADLPNTRIARIGDDSKSRIAADVPARIHKLRVVEDVEKFETDIESEILLNCGPLQYAEIGIVESRAVKEAPVGRPKSSESAVLNECACGWHTWVRIRGRGRLWRDEETSRVVGGRAIGICVTRIQRHDLANEIRHIRGRTAGQRIITVGLVHLDGKAGREPRDPLNLPALSQALRRIAESPVERDGPNVTDHKIVSDVAGRQPSAQLSIFEIHQVVESRRIVQAFSKGIRRQERKIAGLALYRDLRGVVDRIGARKRIGVVGAVAHLRSAGAEIGIQNLLPGAVNASRERRRTKRVTRNGSRRKLENVILITRSAAGGTCGHVDSPLRSELLA